MILFLQLPTFVTQKLTLKTISDDITIQVTEFCLRIFAGQENFELPLEYHYSHLPLCAIDAVFSIGVTYQSVTNTVDRFCRHFNIEKHQAKRELTTSDCLAMMYSVPSDELTQKIYKNRQRTSTANGILKSEAVMMFLEVLREHGVECFASLTDKTIEKLEPAIRQIPGQGSGISWNYFLMLAGRDYYIKPDRMILRFLETVTQTHVKPAESILILREVTTRMNQHGFHLTPRELDSLIWEYQKFSNLTKTSPGLPQA